MAQRKGGYKRKTRYKLTKKPSERGRIPIGRIMQDLKDGDRVHLRIDPSYHKGIFYPRFHGQHGTIVGKQGACFLVSVQDKDKPKVIISHPCHLIKIS